LIVIAASIDWLRFFLTIVKRIAKMPRHMAAMPMPVVPRVIASRSGLNEPG
jgi:hypothetical protein